MERFSIKIAPKHIIFGYSWDKKETNKLFRLVCLFWWKRRESNPRPKTTWYGFLRVQSVYEDSPHKPPTDRQLATVATTP